MHHLILEYFKRKVNKKAHQHVADFESKQSTNSSSFDFCVNEVFQFKCDFMQWIGTDMASVTVRKSVVVLVAPKQLPHDHTSADDDPANKGTTLYSKYSIGLSVLKYKLTVGHLNVIQFSSDSEMKSYLHVEYDSYRGQTVPVGRFEVSHTASDGDDSIGGGDGGDRQTGDDAELANKVAHIKLSLPDVVMWTKKSWHSDHSLVIHVNALLHVQLAHSGPVCHECPHHNMSMLDITADVQTTAEIVTSSLVSDFPKTKTKKKQLIRINSMNCTFFFFSSLFSHLIWTAAQKWNHSKQ